MRIAREVVLMLGSVLLLAVAGCGKSSSTSGSTSGSSGSSSGSTGTSEGTGTSGSSATSGSSGTTGSSGSSGSIPTGAPRVLYTDIVSGPNSGGEGNRGIYLSIFGMNFGSAGLGSTVKVYIHDVEVGGYRYLGPSKGRPDIEQITVQVGALGNPTPGTALPIKVVVNGVASNTDHTFTVNPGKIYFVDNVHGSDSTGVAGDITHPFRYAQTPALYTGGAWSKVGPGDFIVLRGTGTPWTDVGFESYFLRYRDKSGSAPTGAAGTGPIIIMGYPGEDVFIRGTVANGMTGGCISAINGQTYPNAGRWGGVVDLRMDCDGYDGPVSEEIEGDHWRVINNNLAASTAPASGSNAPKMAGITGNGTGSIWLGNNIHDIQGSPQECHGIYIDGDGSYEIAYNFIHDIRSGNGFQVYVNGGNGSDVADDVHFHHNWIQNVSKHGINIADGSRNGFEIYDNVVESPANYCLRFNTLDLSGAKIFNNTFSDCDASKTDIYGAMLNDWGDMSSSQATIVNNIFVVHSGAGYLVGQAFGSGMLSHNLWFGLGAPPSEDSSAVSGDPLFVHAGTDFHLQVGSPAIDHGASSVSSLVTDDYTVLTGRPQGTAFDIGAYEYKP